MCDDVCHAACVRDTKMMRTRYACHTCMAYMSLDMSLDMCRVHEFIMWWIDDLIMW